MKKTIEETTRLLLQGTLTKDEADKILLDLYLVSNQRELLLAFCEFMHGGTYDSHNTTHSQDVDAFLESQ
jgi:hypothetical protein